MKRLSCNELTAFPKRLYLQKLSGIFRKLGCVCFLLLLTSLLPLPGSVISNLSITAEASEVTEEDEYSKIKLNVAKQALVKGDSYTLKTYRLTKNQKVVFKSSDTEVVTIEQTDDKNATVTGVSVGTATITAAVKEGFKTVKTMTCKITVTAPASLIKLIISRLDEENCIVLKVDEEISLKTELKPASTAEVPTYTIKNSKVAAISTSGTIVAKTPGKTVVTATIANGKCDSCTILVIANEDNSSNNANNDASSNKGPSE